MFCSSSRDQESQAVSHRETLPTKMHLEKAVTWRRQMGEKSEVVGSPLAGEKQLTSPQLLCPPVPIVGVTGVHGTTPGFLFSYWDASLHPPAWAEQTLSY